MTSSTKSKNSNRMARKIQRLIFTDACCWIPTCVIAYLYICGVTIDDQVLHSYYNVHCTHCTLYIVHTCIQVHCTYKCTVQCTYKCTVYTARYVLKCTHIHASTHRYGKYPGSHGFKRVFCFNCSGVVVTRSKLYCYPIFGKFFRCTLTQQS